MMKLILATQNPGKVKEMEALLKDLDFDIISSRDFPDIPHVVEDGNTFRENAVKKAATISSFTGCIALADDSGLEIDVLNGQPGVLSARFSGEEGNDRKNIETVLRLMKNVPLDKRQARFQCVIALAEPGRETVTVEGTCEGLITEEPRGTEGFGYDPIFLDPDRDMTFAELGLDIKNRISHRAKALQAAKTLLLQRYAHPPSQVTPPNKASMNREPRT